MLATFQARHIRFSFCPFFWSDSAVPSPSAGSTQPDTAKETDVPTTTRHEDPRGHPEGTLFVELLRSPIRPMLMLSVRDFGVLGSVSMNGWRPHLDKSHHLRQDTKHGSMTLNGHELPELPVATLNGQESLPVHRPDSTAMNYRGVAGILLVLRPLGAESRRALPRGRRTDGTLH